MLLKTRSGESPRISASTYVCESAVITGDVIIGEKVFIAPHASIRADEPGSQIIIGNCFIGFNSVVFDCSIGDGCFVSHRALVRGVKISSRKAVEDGAVVVGQIQADRLEEVGAEQIEFASSVVSTNIMLADSYQLIRKQGRHSHG